MMSDPGKSGGHHNVAPKQGMPTLKIAYFFSGASRKSSVMSFVAEFCTKGGFGLEFHEVDIMNNSKHDLMSENIQEDWIARVESGEFDSLSCLPLAVLGAEPTGPTRMAPHHAATAGIHGACPICNGTNRGGQKMEINLSTSRFGQCMLQGP